MSLIVTSASQDKYGRFQGGNPTRTLAGVEAPSQYQNHFTSPIKIPPNAEIAVESVKIRRDALIDVESQTLMYTYFGKLQTTAPGYQERLEMPIPLRPSPGVYSTDEWVDELDKKFNEKYGNPEIFGNSQVITQVNASGDAIGIDIRTTQRGTSASGTAGKNIVEETGAMLSNYWKSPVNLTTGYEPGTDWSCAHSPAGGGQPVLKTFTKSGANVGADSLERLDKQSCSVQGHGHPFGLVNGEFVVRVLNASGGGWRVGLARPQMEYYRDTTRQNADGSYQRQAFGNLLPGTRHPDGGFSAGENMSTHYNKHNPFNGRNQQDFYDFMVEDNGTDIRVYQMSYDNTLYTNQIVMSEVKYYYAGSPQGITAPLTSADFYADYEYVMFKCVGDRMTLSFYNTGLAKESPVISLTSSAQRDRCFLPLSETRNALYPRLNIADSGENLQIYHYSSHYTAGQYKFPTLVDATATFTTGDDFYSNNRVTRRNGTEPGDENRAILRDAFDRPYCLSQTLLCDTKDKMIVDQLGVSTATSVFDGLNASGTGMNKKHAYQIGHVKPDSKYDYLEGKYRTEEFSGQAKMNRLVGFPNKSLIDQDDGTASGYVNVSANHLQVNFLSFKAPDFRVHSAYVRISNMPIQSYNGAKQSVSKILYHLPRFTNDGREYGDLFFAPGEKTYVSLHNPGSEILNNIEVQLVDVNERPISDISGNTIVVFHLRQKS